MDIIRSPLFSFLEKSFVKQIKMTGYSDQRILIVTKSDQVYGLGPLPDFKNTNNLELRPIPQLHKKNVERFVFGENFILILTASGEVYGWGENENGQLGIGGHEGFICKPTEISSLEGIKVIDITCGLSHVVALGSRQQTYEWGYDGISDIFFDPVYLGTEAIGIANSANASFYISLDGEVFGLGFLNISPDSGYYSIGNGYLVHKTETWSVIANFSNIKKIACGKSHAMALNNDGVMFVWGDNQKKQLSDNIPTHQGTPIKFTLVSEKIIDIAANSQSDISAAMTESSKIYVWGGCSGGNISTPYLTTFTSFEEVFTFLSHPSMTYKGITFENVNLNEFPETRVLGKIFDVKEDSDLTITVEEKNIYVHKVILKATSKYFSAMFTNQWKENSKKVLKIDGYSYDSYKSFLSYLYTGEIILTSENVFELMAIADKYSDDALYDLIEEKLDDCPMPHELVRVLKDLMALSSTNFEKFREGMKKLIVSPTSEYQ